MSPMRSFRPDFVTVTPGAQGAWEAPATLNLCYGVFRKPVPQALRGWRPLAENAATREESTRWPGPTWRLALPADCAIRPVGRRASIAERAGCRTHGRRGRIAPFARANRARRHIRGCFT
jgi:hypothetical protein